MEIIIEAPLVLNELPKYRDIMLAIIGLLGISLVGVLSILRVRFFFLLHKALHWGSNHFTWFY